MPIRLPRRSLVVRRPAIALALVLGAGLLLAACAPAIESSFDPASPCDPAANEQMKGSYPDLEARIPTTIDDRTADSRDSGRFCSKETLGSIYDAGVTEIRFGGGIWRAGDSAGIQLTAFEGNGLTAAVLAEENRLAAEAAERTEAVKTTTLTIAGRPAWRIDLVDGASRQAVVVWGSADGAAVQVVVATDVDEAQLQAAIAAYR